MSPVEVYCCFHFGNQKAFQVQGRLIKKTMEANRYNLGAAPAASRLRKSSDRCGKGTVWGSARTREMLELPSDGSTSHLDAGGIRASRGIKKWGPKVGDTQFYRNRYHQQEPQNG